MVDRAARAGLKAQRPFVVWLTGRPGAGKSSIANALEARLLAAGRHTVLLDGANLRRGLSKDLSFTDADRAENNRRASEVAHLMTDAGLIVIAAFVSPFRADRETARSLFDEGEFIEVFVDLPAELAAERDTTGLYAKAETAGVINLTGVDSTYEDPEEPDLRLDMTELDVEAAADRVLCAARASAGCCRDLAVVLVGLVLGLIVGLTGVGGGSLMTPILIIFFGFKPTYAVGTDIFHGAVFKTFGAWRHRRLGTVHGHLALWLFAGSGPAAIAGVAVSCVSCGTRSRTRDDSRVRDRRRADPRRRPGSSPSRS